MAITAKPFAQNKGSLFFTDIAIIFIAVLFSLLLILSTDANILEAKHNEISKNKFLIDAIMLTDYIVKSKDVAFYDSLKHRVIENKIQRAKLLSSLDSIKRKAKNLSLRISSIAILSRNQREIIFQSHGNNNNCILIERFALVDDERSILEIGVCNE